MLNQSSLAAGVGVSVENTSFAAGAQNLPRKIVIVGTYDPAKDGVAPHVPRLVLSPEDVGYRCGFGTMLHRLAVQAFKGSLGVETWILPQEEAAGADAAVGSIDFTASAGVKAGPLHLYIANDYAGVNLSTGMTPAQIATAVVAAINAIKTLPVTAAVAGGTPGEVVLTAKSKGPWGDGISIACNLGLGQVLPTGVIAAISAMSGGAGVPAITGALNALGTGDSANESYFTDFIHGYGQDAVTLNAISAYVGEGNDTVGLYGKTVARPFRALCGNVAPGSDALSDLVTLANTRILDRANGVLAVPGSYTHPDEIAALAMGTMARISQNRAAQSPAGIRLPGVHPGSQADRWTNDYDNRDIAVKNGISPTAVKNGVVYLQNVVTFYRPANVPVESNGYRSMRNIAILQNVLFNLGLNFAQEKWQGISIVADVAAVSSTVDREKARDIDAVIDDLVALAIEFERHAWVYEADFTINELKKPGAVQIRPGGTGFDSNLPIILSGEGGILDTKALFDTSLAVLTNG